jgi:hypothetical protein
MKHSYFDSDLHMYYLQIRGRQATFQTAGLQKQDSAQKQQISHANLRFARGFRKMLSLIRSENLSALRFFLSQWLL